MKYEDCLILLPRPQNGWGALPQGRKGIILRKYEERRGREGKGGKEPEKNRGEPTLTE